MKNLSKTIDQILKIESSLGDLLIPIKKKWQKGPRKTLYWKELTDILNKKIDLNHPKRSVIEKLFLYKKKIVKKKIYTFTPAEGNEKLLGIIPEYLESKLRRLDLLKIKWSKKGLEAKLTNNMEFLVEVFKNTEKIDIEQKKLWYELKNIFNIWKIQIPCSFYVRSSGTLLAMTMSPLRPEDFFVPPIIQNEETEIQQKNIPTNNSNSLSGQLKFMKQGSSFSIDLDWETLKKVLKFLNHPLNDSPE